MNDIIRKKMINKIVSTIPSYIKPVDYLSTSLDIAKESAYRRLRGEMSFTFDEIIKLSQELEFSVDELINSKNSNQITLNLQINKDPEQTFLLKLQNYKKDIDIRLQYKDSSAIMALNYLPAIFSIHFKSLFKFSYYTWLHRKYKGMPKLYYADVIIPDEFEALRKELDIKTRDVSNNTFILDMNVFLSPLREVYYFYKLRLISDDELETIKTDFHNMIDFVEKIVRTGESNPGTKYSYYISNFNIDGNSAYSNCDGNIISSFNFHYFNTILISDPEVCESHKEWLESLKKYSILVTQSNEMIQEQYFDKQRAYIDHVKDGNF